MAQQLQAAVPMLLQHCAAQLLGVVTGNQTCISKQHISASMAPWKTRHGQQRMICRLVAGRMHGTTSKQAPQWLCRSARTHPSVPLPASTGRRGCMACGSGMELMMQETCGVPHTAVCSSGVPQTAEAFQVTQVSPKLLQLVQQGRALYKAPQAAVDTQ
jgi:hypothetical protein